MWKVRKTETQQSTLKSKKHTLKDFQQTGGVPKSSTNLKLNRASWVRLTFYLNRLSRLIKHRALEDVSASRLYNKIRMLKLF